MIRLAVVVQTNTFAVPTAAYCKSVRDFLGFSGPVVYDSLGVFTELSTASNFHLVADSGLTVRYRGNYPTLEEVQTEIVKVLGP